MQKKYYIQTGSSVAIDIYEEFGIYVKETSGLTEIAETKEIWSRDWKDEQGIDVYIPTDVLFKEKDVEITFIIDKSSVSDVRSTIKSFIAYIISNGLFNYFDTYKLEGSRLFYNKSKSNIETYRDSKNIFEFTLNFIAPNGIAFGFDNSSGAGIFITINSGIADVYFSDGVSYLNVSEDFIYNLTGGFVIIYPSVYNGVSVTNRQQKVLGITGLENNFVLGINGKVLGI